MAFCKQCGTDIKDAKFCPSCGTAANGDVVANDRHFMNADIRRQSLAEMSDMLKYFGAKQSAYDEQDSLEDEIQKRESKGYYGWLICGIIFSLINYRIFSVNGFMLGFFIVLSIFPITSFAIFILFKRKNSKKLRIARNKHEKVTAELDAHYAAYGYCPFGIEYTDPEILSAINDYIRQGRANTPEDALNRLLEDLNNSELKAKMDAQLLATEEVRKEVERTGKSARKAANYASANFWFK